jgi:CO/xanthine dehydrogenase Mo-binding subunit
MDELAEMAKFDPVAFRLAHLKDPRARAVIDAAAANARWLPGTKGDGSRGRGFAYSRYKNIGMYAAVVADVEVDRRTGTVRVPQVVIAADVGGVINPDGVASQLEGGIAQAVSLSLKEQVMFDRQRITTRDWSDYPILTFPEVPSIRVILVGQSDDPPLGAGEGSLAPATAAVANAFADATGRRLRLLPMTPDRVKAALM